MINKERIVQEKKSGLEEMFNSLNIKGERTIKFIRYDTNERDGKQITSAVFYWVERDIYIYQKMPGREKV